MKHINLLSSLTIALLVTLSISGCEEGPAEETGEKLDKIVEDAGDALDDAGNAIEDACEKVKKDVKAKDTDC